jgi:hypothetical protein
LWDRFVILIWIVRVCGLCSEICDASSISEEDGNWVMVGVRFCILEEDVRPPCSCPYLRVRESPDTFRESHACRSF